MQSYRFAAQAMQDANALFIGRGMGLHYTEVPSNSRKSAIFMLKAYAAGEDMASALLSKGYPVIAVATNSPVYDKMISISRISRLRYDYYTSGSQKKASRNQKAQRLCYLCHLKSECLHIASVPLQAFARSSGSFLWLL